MGKCLMQTGFPLSLPCIPTLKSGAMIAHCSQLERKVSPCTSKVLIWYIMDGWLEGAGGIVLKFQGYNLTVNSPYISSRVKSCDLIPTLILVVGTFRKLAKFKCKMILNMACSRRQVASNQMQELVGMQSCKTKLCSLHQKRKRLPQFVPILTTI